MHLLGVATPMIRANKPYYHHHYHITLTHSIWVERVRCRYKRWEISYSTSFTETPATTGQYSPVVMS